MAPNVPTLNDGFQAPVALNSLRELLRWLVLRQDWEQASALDDCDCVARWWAVLPHEGEIYVEVATGLNGQGLLNRFPGLSTLPVTPGPRAPVASGAPCEGHLFYFGPFSDALDNL